MTKIKNIIKTYFSNKKRLAEIIATLGLTMIFLGVIVMPIVSFAGLDPVKSITISSENLSYENNEPGSWQITKSARWTSKGKAQITFELDTLVKTNNVDNDVILVLDTSGSMNGERLDKLKNDTTSLITDILSNENNNVSLITFSTDSEIKSNFTKDSTLLIESINNLEAIGNTNYYKALVNVDAILKNYTWEENKDCVVLFLTDGYPNEDSPNEIAQYHYLKTTYPRLVINSIQYEMGEEQVEILKNISDNQYNANIDNLETYLYRASMSPLEYETFEIIDYIDNLYFSITDSSSIKTYSGTYALENNKITWNLDKINSGSNHKMTIDITLNDGLSGLGEVFPTNEETQVISLIDTIEENIMVVETPRLTDTYKIIYEENAPDSCTVENLPDQTTASVFDTISITDKEPTCEGYQFKEWKIVNKEIQVSSKNSFIMPEADATLRATWSKLSSTKSMDGKVSVVQNLYQMMADNSTPDNIASDYVTSSTGINFGASSSDTNGKGIYQAVKLEGEDTPIYYYRGNVTNNNLRFAGFCWKIVRTTETKGVKLIYNGVPNEDGSCTATSDSTQIGTGLYNENDTVSPASLGYIYGDVYSSQQKSTSITGIGNKTLYRQYAINNTNYIYSSTISYDEETSYYTLVDGENRIWNDTYSVGTGNLSLYTCLSETENKCTEIAYVVDSSTSYLLPYATFTGGDTAEQELSKEIVYGNDVIFDSETNLYTLQTTMTSKIKDWNTDYSTIAGVDEPGYHYTCLNNEITCSIVTYIFRVASGTENAPGSINYVELTNGVNIEEAVKKMTTEPDYITESTMKKYIDSWYENSLISYTDKLEDTPFCNDLTISNYAGWTKDGNATTRDISFAAQTNIYNGTPKFSCLNSNNAYTVSDTENGNGQLKYPVAILTSNEFQYAGAGIYGRTSNCYLITGQYQWTLSPERFQSPAYMAVIYANGGISNHYVYADHDIRPSISLKAGTRSIDGDGSPEDPFVVE